MPRTAPSFTFFFVQKYYTDFAIAAAERLEEYMAKEEAKQTCKATEGRRNPIDDDDDDGGDDEEQIDKEKVSALLKKLKKL